MILQPNNNLGVLPWYTSLNLQNHRKPFAYGRIYPLYASAYFLLPFQIIRPARDTEISYVKVLDKNRNVIADITNSMKESGLQIMKFPSLGYDAILYPATLPLSNSLPEGQYFLTLSDNVQAYYSEMITIVYDMSSFLMIEWWDTNDLVFDSGFIVYKTPGNKGGESYHNRLYLKTELGRPEYTFEEEGESRDGYFFPLKQLSEKIYRFIITAPEYLCDAMRFIRMSDFVIVRDTYGRMYDCDTFLITPKWLDQGYLASVEVEFETSTIIKKLSRAITPEKRSGDFNNDFNNDYKITI